MSEIELQGIHFQYTKDEKVYQDFSVGFEKNDLVFILGANGSGKSSLLKLILGALAPQKGEVLFEGKNTSEKERASLLGYIPQSYALDPEMSVNDTLNLIGSLYGLNGAVLVERKHFLGSSLGFEKLLDKQIKQLSGGQKQLVNIALGLIHDPKILLLDEPFVGLDYGIKSKLISFLTALDKTILCVSHDLEMAESYADKILLLKDGSVANYSNPKALISSHPFFLKEIDFKKQADASLNIGAGIAIIAHDNRLILSCPDETEYKEKVFAYEQENALDISGTRSYERNLIATLVGKYQFSLDKKKVQKGKKGGGKGQGKKHKKQ